jgi:hypothetical protein
MYQALHERPRSRHTSAHARLPTSAHRKSQNRRPTRQPRPETDARSSSGQGEEPRRPATWRSSTVTRASRSRSARRQHADGHRLRGRGERPCGGLLVPVTLHQRSAPAEQLGAATSGPGSLAADALEVDPTFQSSVPGVFVADDLSSPMPSVANAVAAGSGVAAMVVQDLTSEVPYWDSGRPSRRPRAAMSEGPRMANPHGTASRRSDGSGQIVPRDARPGRWSRSDGCQVHEAGVGVGSPGGV